uniref:Anaphase-promoting complex subunit 13 n=1 Tax=Panagrellus redivivus TaxID=6233 RepID=A0A7E4ZQN4_PANRE
MSDKSHPDSDLCIAGPSSMASNPSSSLKRPNEEAPDHPKWLFPKRPASEFGIHLEQLTASEARNAESSSIPKRADVIIPQQQQAEAELSSLDLRPDALFRLAELEASAPYVPPRSNMTEEDVAQLVFMNKYHRARNSKTESGNAGTDSDDDNDYLYPSSSKKE